MADPLQLAQAARSYQDIKNQQSLTDLQAKLLGVQGMQGENTYATQLISGAIPGGQQAYDQVRQSLHGHGFDISAWAPDVQTAAQQAQAARLAQSPLGSLLGAATKFDANNNAAAIAGGNVPSNPNAVAQGLLAGGVNAMVPGGAALLQQSQPRQQVIQSSPSQVPVDVGNTQAGDTLPPIAPINAAAQQVLSNATQGSVPVPIQNQQSRFAGATAPPIKQSGETLDAYKARIELWKADPSLEFAKTVASKTAEQSVSNVESAKSAQDISRLYAKINQDAATAPSGMFENLYADATNAMNVPSPGAIAKGTYDADLNNLYLGMIRSLKGTGRVMQSELDNIKDAQPKSTDSMAVKQSKAAAHFDYYQNRMEQLGYDPATGRPLGNNQLTPIPIQPNQSQIPQNNPFSGTSSATGSQPKVWPVQNDNDYNLLPKGAQYQGPDGVMRIK